MAPEPVTTDLAAVVRAALGGDRRLEAVQRVAGGTRKGSRTHCSTATSPDREFIRDVAEHNLNQALALVSTDPA